MPTSLTTQPAVTSREHRHRVVDCPIGEAIAILMARHDITYTRAFAGLIVSSEQIHRSVPDIAAEIVRTRAARDTAESPSPQLPDGGRVVPIGGIR